MTPEERAREICGGRWPANWSELGAVLVAAAQEEHEDQIERLDVKRGEILLLHLSREAIRSTWRSWDELGRLLHARGACLLIVETGTELATLTTDELAAKGLEALAEAVRDAAEEHRETIAEAVAEEREAMALFLEAVGREQKEQRRFQVLADGIRAGVADNYRASDPTEPVSQRR